MRRCHWLSRNARSESVHAVLFVDTETDQRLESDGSLSHHLSFGWSCFRRTRLAADWTEPEWHRFESVPGFWDHVESLIRPRTRLHMFAHNWGFDAAVLDTFNELPGRNWKLRQAVIDCPPVILSWRKDTRSIRMLDTLNWWRMPLFRIGESLSLPKLTMPSANASAKEWDIYARRDVDIIHVAIMEWLDFLLRYDLGTFGPTLASQAMRAYRHRYMKHPVLIDDDVEALQLARKSLHGGRTEAFFIGRVDHDVYCLDVNSMYPAVMRDNLFPSKLVLHARDPDASELVRWTRDYCVVARCLVETERNKYAHLVDDKLVFPVGQFETVLTSPDVRDAMQHDEIRKVSEIAVFDSAPLFQEFVESIYSLRQGALLRGESVRVWLLKILMNSLYGKFAQRGENWNNVDETPDTAIRVWRELDLETGRIYSYRQFGGVIQLRSVEPESHDSHPAIAAHVTAYARDLLWALIQEADPANVLYVDTDSLWVNPEGKARLEPRIDPSRLGALKIEGWHKGMTIHGAKDYLTESGIVCKGVHPKARWIGPSEVEQEQWSTLAGLLRRSQLHAPLTRSVRKVLHRVYDKGQVTPSGQVLPLTLR